MRVIRLFLTILLSLALIGSFGLFVLPYIYPDSHYFDLASNFLLQIIWVQLACLVGFAMLARWRFVLFSLLIVVISAIPLIPYYVPRMDNAEAVSNRFKLMHMNVLGINDDTDAVVRAIQAENPDMLVLEEYNEKWRNALTESGILKQFPHRYVVKFGNDGFYSKIPLKSTTVSYNTEKHQDSTAVIRFSLEGKPITLLMVHPRPPTRPKWHARNRKHFSKWIREFPRYGENVLVVGDLNSTPWAASFRELIAKTGLRDSQLSFGIQPSWPIRVSKKHTMEVKLPFPLIPIDHVLVSKNFVVLNRKLGPDMGSDHLPVIVELGLR